MTSTRSATEPSGRRAAFRSRRPSSNAHPFFGPGIVDVARPAAQAVTHPLLTQILVEAIRIHATPSLAGTDRASHCGGSRLNRIAMPGKKWAYEDFVEGASFALGTKVVTAEEIIEFASEFDPSRCISTRRPAGRAFSAGCPPQAGIPARCSCGCSAMASCSIRPRRARPASTMRNGRSRCWPATR